LRFDHLKSLVRALPQVAAWPQMLELIERSVHRDQRSVWELPVAACRAVGGTSEAALAGAAAVFCSLLSIHLVDDMLDDDPQGDFHALGGGPAANLALAFQAAAHGVLDAPAVPPAVRAELHACLGRMALATAYGQHLDSREVASEEEYWLVVGNKTPPLFGAALKLGALLGGAPPARALELERLGCALGKFVQVGDDLSDALCTPAGADWRRPSNNLPILYAMLAEHPARAEFQALAAATDQPQSLAAAQKVLLQCGGVSYCAWKMVELAHEAQDILAGAALADRQPLSQLLTAHVRPLTRLLASVGFKEPLLAIS
jgi:geranylgeranyl pyrophosphate synthase